MGEPFPDGNGEPRTINPAEGDYVARIHQALKLRIAELRPGYQYPRRHSFQTRIEELITLGLLERTGRKEPPQERGAGVLGTAGGFQERTWVRIVSAQEASDLWNDPMKAILERYGLERPAIFKRPKRPRARLKRVEAPPEEALRPDGRRRPRRRAVVEEATEVVSEALEETHTQLDLRRQGLLDQATSAARSGEALEIFQSLERDLAEFLDRVRPYYRVHPLSDAITDLGTLTGCIQSFSTARTRNQIQRALSACRSGSEVIAIDLSTPLPLPDRTPEEAPGPVVERARRRPPRAPRPAVEVALPAAPPSGEIPAFTLAERPNRQSLQRLFDHLSKLSELGEEIEEEGAVAAELQRLSEAFEGWQTLFEDVISEEEDKDDPNEDRLDRLRELADTLTEISGALEELDLSAAVGHVENAMLLTWRM